MKVLSINDITPTTITATIEHNGTEVDYELNRHSFEDWLTEGTGIVTDDTDSCNLADYWEFMGLNDTHHKQHVGYYMKANRMPELLAVVAYQRIQDILTDVQPDKLRHTIQVSVRDYAEARSAVHSASLDRVAKIREV